MPTVYNILPKEIFILHSHEHEGPQGSPSGDTDIRVLSSATETITARDIPADLKYYQMSKIGLLICS